ncbi:MAG: hypothetical protein ABIH38_04550 [Patescibacteria group bacterium]
MNIKYLNNNKKQSYFLLIFDALTIVVWLLLLLEFFTQNKIFLPTLLTSIYIIILTFYASDKEIRRWRHRLKRTRRGEAFVILWVATLLFILGFYFFHGKNLGYIIPGDLLTITGSVMVIYIITDILKEEFQKKNKSK